MSWKSKSSDRFSRKAAWHSSDDEHSYSRYSHKHKHSQNPATTSEEALWRASTRLSAAWRWLKLDLALLADVKNHNDIISSLENTIQQIGIRLLPDLGYRPLDPTYSARPEVLDFVGVLTSLQSPSSNATGKCDRKVEQSIHSTGTSTQGLSIASCKSVQTAGGYLTRFTPDELTGEWVPLTASTVRRGAVIKCTSNARSNTNGSLNFLFSPGQIVKVVDIDLDGDARVCALEEARINNLWEPSDRTWLLRSSFEAFDVWWPFLASSDAAQELRRSRSCEKSTEDVT